LPDFKKGTNLLMRFPDFLKKHKTSLVGLPDFKKAKNLNMRFLGFQIRKPHHEVFQNQNIKTSS